MTFAEDFAKNRGQPIVVAGRAVTSMLRFTLRPGTRIQLIWSRAVEAPLQGIRMKLRGGDLGIGDVGLNDVVLWRDTTPNESVFVCRSKKSADLRIWNCWRDDRGVMQAWVGNAGMRVSESSPTIVRVECNSRLAITFADSIFELVFEEP